MPTDTISDCNIGSEAGIWLHELPVGALLELKTASRTYTLENQGSGRAWISGHPEYCPQPVLVTVHGSTWGGMMLRARYIGVGMCLEYEDPALGVVRTSGIREIRSISAES
jgi:hypothetical protein